MPKTDEWYKRRVEGGGWGDLFVEIHSTEPTVIAIDRTDAGLVMLTLAEAKNLVTVLIKTIKDIEADGREREL